ncbi:hypothetical protein ACXR0O_08940 [Verrucomicrobiota bacterium sgz303538]
MPLTAPLNRRQYLRKKYRWLTRVQPSKTGIGGEADMITTELLRRRLELVFDWYRGMVNPYTGMLEYLYLPEADRFIRENCPIRDIASVWDVEVLGKFLDREELLPLIERSLLHYDSDLVERDGYTVLDSRRLGEPSSIAHSAFMIPALLHAPPPHKTQQIAALVEGILHQQRPDGSYKVYFDDLPDQGEELYAGEAMLALLEAHRQLHDTRYLQSAERGSLYYDVHYWKAGRVSNDLLVFFANWQSQACRLVFESTVSATTRDQTAQYVFAMHDEIIDRGYYRDIEQDPRQQVSVEVACALEGLNEAYFIARALSDQRAEHYGECICAGLEYLAALQTTDSSNLRERGGFGLTLSQRAQRIDITGHAACAFMKSLENGIACG